MKSDKVVVLDCETRLDLDPDRVLKAAMGQLQGVVILGYDKEGMEYFASSWADGAVPNWLIDRCKMRLLTIGTEGDDD
jgi:hypothetical protein